jgi:hypothetical protein
MQDRFVPSSPPSLVCCKPPFSFYKFMGDHWPGSEANRTLHRVFSLMRKMNVRTLALENLARKGELAIEARAVEKRCTKKVDFKASRLSFFSRPITEASLPYAIDDDYLGYAVFVSIALPDGTNRRYVYESVVAEPCFHSRMSSEFAHALPSHYIHCVRRYLGFVGEYRFGLTGSFFSQQNNLTHVCAHAALRWLLNNLPERAEEIISYEEINRDLGIDHSKRKVGKYAGDAEALGLRMDDLLGLLDKRKYKYIDVDFETPHGRSQPYWRFIYSIIEAGYPALIFFTAAQARHVICAIGHTLNSDIWDSEAKLAYSGAPRAEYLSTASWVDHFIIHDDNYGMYYCLPAKALSPSTKDGGAFQVTGALGIVPTDVQLGPLEAESLASLCLHLILTLGQLPLYDCYWLKTMREEEAASGRWLVFRTLFTGKAAYERHLQCIEDPERNTLKKGEIAAIVNQSTPEHFWITEITLTDIYTANKRKLGEILFKLSDPQIKPEDSAAAYTRRLFAACIGIRLPGNIIVSTVDETQVILTRYGTDLTGHVPLFRAQHPIPRLEW